MTQRFILDENVVMYAQRGQNEYGERDATCMRLFQQIIEICHTLVVDVCLWGKYHSQINSLGPTDLQVGVRVLSVLANAFRMEGKIDLRPNAAPFPEEAAIPAGSQDDVEIVRLAVETGATLVTTDKPLRDDLESCGVRETYDLTLLPPGEALGSL